MTATLSYLGSKVVRVRAEAIRNIIVSNLINSSRYRGRALSKALDFLGLPAGARLEPSGSLLDVYSLETVALPIDLEFWVGSPDGRILHQSPLFMIPGVGICSWCIDLLHAWVLGPLGKLIGLCIHLFLMTLIFHPTSQHLSAANKNKIALQHLKANLREHYKRAKIDDPTWHSKHSEVQLSVSLRFVRLTIYDKLAGGGAYKALKEPYKALKHWGATPTNSLTRTKVILQAHLSPP